MTNQQKYIELMEKYEELGDMIDSIAGDRADLRDHMTTIANGFPDSFYFKVQDKLLFRSRSNSTIQLKEFTK